MPAENDGHMAHGRPRIADQRGSTLRTAPRQSVPDLGNMWSGSPDDVAHHLAAWVIVDATAHQQRVDIQHGPTTHGVPTYPTSVPWAHMGRSMVRAVQAAVIEQPTAISQMGIWCMSHGLDGDRVLLTAADRMPTHVRIDQLLRSHQDMRTAATYLRASSIMAGCGPGSPHPHPDAIGCAQHISAATNDDSHTRMIQRMCWMQAMDVGSTHDWTCLTRGATWDTVLPMVWSHGGDARVIDDIWPATSMTAIEAMINDTRRSESWRDKCLLICHAHDARGLSGRALVRLTHSEPEASMLWLERLSACTGMCKNMSSDDMHMLIQAAPQEPRLKAQWLTQAIWCMPGYAHGQMLTTALMTMTGASRPSQHMDARRHPDYWRSIVRHRLSAEVRSGIAATAMRIIMEGDHNGIGSSLMSAVSR